MKAIKSLAKKIPGVPRLYVELQNLKQKRKLKGKDPEDIFAEIYERNEWGSNESVSGHGSVLEQTRVVIEELPGIFEKFDIKTMLDVPCGDFNWMKEVDLARVKYTGGDIVDELIKENKRKFETGRITFRKLNLLADELPEVDLIFCRDCLVHFSLEDIGRALETVGRSRSKYLLTTTFTEHERNEDIMTGQWREINLQRAPFSFGEPLALINEECTEAEGKYADKSLGLWRIDEIKKGF